MAASDLFKSRHDSGESQLVARRLAADLDTPVSAFLKLAGDRPFAFLLESVEGGDQLGRYSIIGMDPDAVWRADGEHASLNRSFTDDPLTFEQQDAAPLDSLKAFIEESRVAPPPDGAPLPPPMAAGVFGYLGYDIARQIERLPAPPPRYADTPDAIMMRPTLIAVFDNVRQEISLFSPARPTAGVDAQTAFEAAEARLDAAVARLSNDAGLARPAPRRVDGEPQRIQPTSSMTPDAYCAAVKAAKEKIFAGDIFQAVLSQRFEAPFPAPPFSLYRALRRTNPSPFLFYLNFGDHQLVGSSPEILVRVRSGEITIRPIAGTRPRGKTPAEDAAYEGDLLADPKERAEHLMLLDLGRNDVGRSAKIGSVTVTDAFQVERYSHVMHIVSNVVGELADGAHPVDAVAAGFPAGTVTGAPKIRAMEIINELEVAARGPYAGAIGYFSADGSVDTCITLRTGMVKDGVLYVQAGAGIVADSDPQAEHEECRNKARALFAAAEAALAMETGAGEAQ
ncbi:MAG: anthranilate synthase component I [Pseudomonadota bacterium]